MNSNHPWIVALVSAAFVFTADAISAHAGALILDGQDNLFVTGYKSDSIAKFTPEGVMSMFASELNKPGELAFDGAGNLFVLGHDILKFTPKGVKSTFASGLDDPIAMELDRSGNLFVLVEDGHHTDNRRLIIKFTPKGMKSTFATGITYESTMTIDAAGSVFAWNLKADSIVKVTPQGVKSTFASLSGPGDMAFDGSGNLFVCNDVKGSIVKITPNGGQSTFATVKAWTTSGLIFDGSGNLFALDHEAKSIVKFTPDGAESTFAAGLSASEMAFDHSGNLFVYDGTKDSIVKITPNGDQTTFASGRISPDKQWEYQCADDGESAGLAKAGTTQIVLDLDVPPQWANEARVVWAPDSKRFAFNYRSGGRDNTTALYQLQGDKWVALRSPDDSKTILDVLSYAQSIQLAKQHLPKTTYQRRIWDTSEVREWTDDNTAILAAISDRSVMFNSDLSANDEHGDKADLVAKFLFTLKFDAKGNWKIIKTQEMSDED